ncbi:cache domain-containing protein, partial [Campylobacter armoricus]|uniref:cache domain-containing protein n=2 Tax=Campylobacter armoricus TaxID=2505970 RepID=UPI00191BD94F
MFAFKSLSNKFTFISCLLIFTILVVVNIISYYNTKDSTNSYLEEIQMKTMFDVTKFFETYAGNKRSAIMALQEQISLNPNLSEDEILVLVKTIARTANFELMYVGFEHSGKNYQSDGEVLDLSKGYDTRNRGWYKEAKEAKKGTIITTEPYISASTSQIGITYATPIYVDNKFIGVVGGDYNLHTFAKDVLALGHSNSSYA